MGMGSSGMEVARSLGSRRLEARGSDSILARPPQPPGGPALMGSRPLGPILVLLGVAVVVVGLLVWSGALFWVARLPGDVRIERGNVRCYFPITSMILISLGLTLLLNLLRRVF